MSRSRPFPFEYRIANLFARRPLQPTWRVLHKIAFRGLGYDNWVSSLNGEDQFGREWAEGQRASSRPSTVFDVGANEGDFTANLLGRLHAGSQFFLFEPNPKALPRLKIRFAGRADVVLEAAGVGATPGELALHDIQGADGTPRASFISQAITELTGLRTETTMARVVTLDGFCCKHQVPLIDFLKIDTEGFEKEVLTGARRLITEGRIGVIQLEMNEHAAFTGFTLYELHRMLPGYEIYRLLPSYLQLMVGRGRRYLPRNDFFHYCNLVCFNPYYHADNSA